MWYECNMYRGSQNKAHEKERAVLLLQPLHTLRLKSAYTPVYSLKPRPILHRPRALNSQ